MIRKDVSFTNNLTEQ